MPNQIQLEIITQEKSVLSETVDKVGAPAVMGEVTILPGHIPLFTRLNDGIIKIYQGKQYREYAVVGGFMDVAPSNKVTIMADSVIASDEADLEKAEFARQKAIEAMKNRESDISFRLAEASLRKAVMELKVARRRKNRM